MNRTKQNSFVTSSSQRQKSEDEKVGPVGHTDVTSMGISSGLNAENLVLTVLDRSCLGLGASASIVQCVKSLIIPFVCRRAPTRNRPEWFSDKELNRFVESMRKTVIRLMQVENDENREQSFMKYWLSVYLCQVFQDPQRPAKDSWITQPLFSGWLKRFIMRAIARRDVSFIYSLQKGSKQSWPTLGEKKKQEALDKHRARLSESRGEVPLDVDETIARLARRIFCSKMDPSEGVKFLPSGSACLQASRESGGALGLYPKLNLDLDGSLPMNMGRLPVLNRQIEDWRHEMFEYSLFRVKLEAIKLMRGIKTDLLNVKVIAVPEQGKFRIVTKGHGFLYTALQPLQGNMISSWKKRPESTMRFEDLSEKVNQIDLNMSDMPKWCSVDYEAATDLLKRSATFAAMNAMYLDHRIRMGGVNSLVYYLAMVSMLPGQAIYPDRSSVTIGEGQLMGHPLSFPLLCLINLSVYHVAIDRWVEAGLGTRETGRRMKKNVIVNGDDMLFKCVESFYPFFLTAAQDAGLKPSIGKNYLSDDCAMINSQTFRRISWMEGDVRISEMRRYGYLNQNVLFGHSDPDGMNLASPVGTARELNRMVKLCPWSNSIIPWTLSRFNKHFRNSGRNYYPNWYLPTHLGGFGLDVSLSKTDIRITRDQRVLAAIFVANPKIALTFMKGNLSLPLSKMGASVLRWRMVPIIGPLAEGEESAMEDPWLARLAYASRASDGSSITPLSLHYSRLRKQYRLRPMSLSRLEHYIAVRFVASATIPCPPLSKLCSVLPEDRIPDLTEKPDRC